MNVYRNLSKLVVLSLAFSVPALGQDYAPGEVIVKLRSDGKSQESYAFFGKAHSEKAMTLKNSFARMNMYHFNLKPGDDVGAVIQDLKKDPAVEYAEPNYYYRKSSLNENARRFSFAEMEEAVSQNVSSYITASNQISAQGACASTVAGSRARPVVAVIDTGVDITHDALVGTQAIWRNSAEIAGNGIDDDQNGYVDDVNGWNFVTNSGNMYDDDTPGHGTHVAGIIVSVCHNILPGTFTKSKVQIMPLKFLDSEGIGKTSDAIKAIYYAVNNGATVLNNSWGGPSYSGALHEAIVYAYNRGVSFVAAAGNAGSNNDSVPMYPASYDVPNVISVAAVTSLDGLAWFSNFGTGSVHIGSPGVEIYSTLPGDSYGDLSGTSMATPYVAGTAAMMQFERPGMLGYQIKEIVFSSGDYRSTLANKVATNARLNAQKSIDLASAASLASSQPAYSFKNNDRELASSLAAGGCGLVAKLVKDHNSSQGPGGGSPTAPHSWYVLFLIGVLSLPIIVYNVLRNRNPANRRRHERFKISSEVVVAMGDKQLVGSISTISLGGVQLNTEALLENGGIVAMTIRSPDGRDQIQVEGRIVWSEAKRAYGVQFANAKPGALDAISRWTKSLTKA